ncbi:hypothetical protein ABFS82_14G300200 [Erythranthe guttata]|uniref:uncharacterized protein LOC105959583 n=1 Tax=Erythranthe guttata TaxID=4155 RepID=UPI00064DC13B|nr:PREDICTED: uncharacterized protein LOC105959583 [Erythranthe guttata]|eukprot:XP_012839180.1 PREDICTED: uncharacterized protein LOC105959583 [Erythranthe guttata]
MKHSSMSKEYTVLASPTKDETTVAQILLDLNFLFSLTESLSNFNWTCRRRRSSYDAAPPLRRGPSIRKTDDGGIDERRPPVQTEEFVNEKSGAARTTASPDTPLSFSPSDTDQHSSKKNSKKRPRQDYIEMIQGLTQRKDLLRGEIENVKKYYDKLKAYNSELKSMKQKVLNTYPTKQDLQMSVGVGMNPGTELAHRYRIHQQPLIEDPTVHMFQHSVGPITSQLLYPHPGPHGFDLNIPADEAFGEEPSQPLDLNRALVDQRARFAEARRIRREIMKTKSSITTR